MNDFEKHLLQNKSKLEPDHVDNKIWLGIENATLKSSNKRLALFAKTLIAIVMMFVVGYFLWQQMAQALPPDEEKILAEFDLTGYNFTQQVNNKTQQLEKATVPQDKIEDFQILLRQLEFMDGQFQDYRLYIEQNGYQEFIGDQILNFYKSKIELLDKIQSEIEKINYYESKEPSISKKVGFQI